jgi:hypothetical protein
MDAPLAATGLTYRDTLGRWRVRWGWRRHAYRVAPGLYRVGAPTASSPVLVTANYKLSFDAVRSELAEIDAWLLVLDTNGVNVWCAAGKGTFGTDELVRRIEDVGLADVVDHRTIVVPQLGAPGVAAREVNERSGFRVVFGPIRARDIRRFLDAGLRATPEMRRVTFTARERLAVTAVEVPATARIVVPLLVAVWLIWVAFNRGEQLLPGWQQVSRLAPFLAALAAGLVVVPLLLPWLPSRVFALKGAVAGAVLVGLTMALSPEGWSVLGGSAVLLLGTTIASYLAMNYTGSTTFTSPSGVEKEIRWALPVQLGAVAASLLLLVVGWVAP